MKKEYSAYRIGSDVWGISFWNKDGNPTDHCAIYPAKVKGIYISHNVKTDTIETSYELSTPSGDDWGDVIDSVFVSDNFNELVQMMKTNWTKNANTFGD